MKPIQINPELFNMKKNRGIKNKTLKIRNIQPNKLKNDLLSRIKNYKKEREELGEINREEVKNFSNYQNTEESYDQNTEKHDEETLEKSQTDEFAESIDFLKKLSLENDKNQNLIIDQQPMIIRNPNETKVLTNNYTSSNTNSNKNSNTNLNNAPEYSSLKNGSLPTFREWKRMTMKNREDNEDNEYTNHLEVNDDNNFQNKIDLSYEPGLNLKSANNSEIENNKDFRKRNVKYKYTLGKKNGKVSVLIKNNKTRKNIANEHMRIKQVNIHHMKNYLKRHNFLKSGSYAPSDVIKKMYEECLLSGNLKNISSENIHSNLEEN